MDALQELLADARDGDVGDLHLLIADEREQKIEGTRELVQLDDEGRRRVEAEDAGCGHAAPIVERVVLCVSGSNRARRFRDTYNACRRRGLEEKSIAVHRTCQSTAAP